MKKMSLALFVLLMVIISVFTGCSSNGRTIKSLVGVWENGTRNKYVFKSNGTYVFTYEGSTKGYTKGGKYSVSGGRIKLEETWADGDDKGSRVEVYNFSCTDKELAIRPFKGGNTETLVGKWKDFYSLLYKDSGNYQKMENMNIWELKSDNTYVSTYISGKITKRYGKWKYEPKSNKLTLIPKGDNAWSLFVYVVGDSFVFDKISLKNAKNSVYKKKN